MKKILLLGALALAATATSAIAQSGNTGGAPSTVSGGGAPGPMNNSNPTTNAGSIDGQTAERPARGTTTGMSPQDRATVPGSLTAGGTSQGTPNTVQPGSSRQGQ